MTRDGEERPIDDSEDRTASDETLSMAAICNIAGLLMDLAGVILLFQYGMPYRVRTGGSEIRLHGRTDQETVKAEYLYERLGFVGLALIFLGTAAQVVATVWSVR